MYLHSLGLVFELFKFQITSLTTKILKTKFSLIILLLLSISSLYADDAGDINIVLEEHIREYNAAVSPMQKATALRGIIVEASYIDLAISNTYLKKLENLSENTGDLNIKATLYNAKGIMADFQGAPLDTILYWYNQSTTVLENSKVKDFKQRISLYNNRAIAYQKFHMLNLAIKEYTAGLDFLQSLEIKSYTHEVLIYSNIANMLSDVEKFDEALKHILKAEEINTIFSKQLGKPTEYFEYIPSIKAYILYKLNRFDEAEDELEAMLTYNNSLNLTNNYGKILLGKIYSENNKIELGRRLLNEGLDEAIKLDLGIDNQVYAGINLAEFELGQNNTKSSLDHMIYVYGLFADQNKEIDDSEIHEIMAKALEKSGRFEESISFSKKYHELKKIETERENSTILEEFKFKMKDIEKQYLINELEINRNFQENKLKILLAAFSISVFLLFLVYYLYNKKAESNRKLVQINQEATIAKDKAIAAALVKENFLSTMSHEMRTPMNAIIGISNILIDENLCEKQLQLLKSLKFSGEGLLHIINDVLDFSKIEAKKLKINKQEFDLKKFLDSTFNSLKYGSVKDNVKLFQDQQLKSLDHFIICDSKRINQILINLLGNAMKFTDEGHIVLRSRILQSEAPNKVRVIFEVEDSGIGIPGDKLDSIFESFSQVNNQINRVHQGTGLGLGISKRLVELLGGKLTVRSKEGSGSTFSFILEFDKGKPISKDVSDQLKSKIYQSGLEEKKILLVEDNKLNQIVAMKVLKKFGADVQLAENGQEAVDMVLKHNFNLVLMDIHMPIMDGIEATKTIRKLDDPIKNQIPIVALSADAYSDKVAAASDCGMNDYLSKPFKPEDLFEKIRKNMDTNRSLSS